MLYFRNTAVDKYEEIEMMSEEKVGDEGEFVVGKASDVVGEHFET